MSKPRILITTASNFRKTSLHRIDSLTGRNYSEAVVQAGGLPLMVSNLAPELADAYITEADGLLLTGGGDPDPSLFGAEPHPELGEVDLTRDYFELALYRAAKERGIPVFGVCRGVQLINVAEGGTLHQHLPAVPGTIQHDQGDISGTPFHALELEPRSRLATAYGTQQIRSNSYHHQAVDRLGDGLIATARSSDGVIEALETKGEHFVVGVQWHPEMSFRAYPEHHLPFQMFLEAVKEPQSKVGA